MEQKWSVSARGETASFSLPTRLTARNVLGCRALVVGRPASGDKQPATCPMGCEQAEQGRVRPSGCLGCCFSKKPRPRSPTFGPNAASALGCGPFSGGQGTQIQEPLCCRSAWLRSVDTGTDTWSHHKAESSQGLWAEGGRGPAPQTGVATACQRPVLQGVACECHPEGPGPSQAEEL